ncbi:MAG: PIN domain-containing protein [Desulfotignum sp.]|nr:PIN domain-containing protein [Desulfotignum sp.]
MKDNCFVDTNILVYFRDASEPEKQKISGEWLKTLWENQTGRISIQILNEYYVTVTQKLKPGMKTSNARLDIKNLMAWHPVAVDLTIIKNSWSIQDTYQFSWWDSLIVAAAIKANCSILLSEDFQHGQEIHDLTIINPFQQDAGQMLS